MNRSFAGQGSGSALRPSSIPPVGKLSRHPPPPPLPPDPHKLPDLSDFPPLPSLPHSPSSTSPPRSRAKTLASLVGTVSTRPARTPKTSYPTIASDLSKASPFPSILGPTPRVSSNSDISSVSLSLDEMSGSPTKISTNSPPPKLVEATQPQNPNPSPPNTLQNLPTQPQNPSQNLPSCSYPTQDPPFIPQPASADSKQANGVDPPADTWAEKFKKSSDKSLKLLAPPTLTPEGIPRICIPDSVFQKGASLHKDFVKGFFLGTVPSFGQIQSTLNYMWG